jgi:sugar/nucleoside kinase (ribokinase family)
VTFSFLAGGNARLLTGLGRHALADQVRLDLERQGVEIIDVIPGHEAPPPLSCITVSRRNGSRTVVSLDASRFPHLAVLSSMQLLDDVAIVLTDGHLTKLSLTVARAAIERGIPVVLDGGRWRAGTDELLEYVDIAICSRSFMPPDSEGIEAIHDMLLTKRVSAVATTNGADPIIFSTTRSRGEIPVPNVTVVDTLGAGDILHGAFCFYSSRGHSFVEALRHAAIMASASCGYFGTREWMRSCPPTR